LTDISSAPSHVNLDVAGVGPPGFVKPLLKRFKSGLSFLIVCYSHQHTAPPQRVLARLRARHEWPRRRRAPEPSDELTPLQSIELHSISHQPGAG